MIAAPRAHSLHRVHRLELRGNFTGVFRVEIRLDVKSHQVDEGEKLPAASVGLVCRHV